MKLRGAVSDGRQQIVTNGHSHINSQRVNAYELDISTDKSKMMMNTVGHEKAEIQVRLEDVQSFVYL